MMNYLLMALCSLALFTSYNKLESQPEKYLNLYVILGSLHPQSDFRLNSNFNPKITSFSLGARSTFAINKFDIGTEFYNTTGSDANHHYKIQYSGMSSSISLSYNTLKTNLLSLKPSLRLSLFNNQLIIHNKNNLISSHYYKNQYSITPAITFTKFTTKNTKINSKNSPTIEKSKEMILIKNNKANLYTTIYRKDNAATILLLHGGPGVPNNMNKIANILKEKYQVITFEQRGVGKSTCNKCTFTMNDYISDIEAIANYFNVDTFHLFGHSWGGLYAQIYAKEKPKKVKSLFLSSPSSGTNKTWKKTEKEVMHFNKKTSSFGEWMAMGWYSLLGMMGNDNAYRKLFKQVLKNYHKNYGSVNIDETILQKIHAAPINKTRKNIEAYKPLSIFSNPTFPIIITYGSNDIYGASTKELIKRFPTAITKIITNSGHIPWLHNPKKFKIILMQFYTFQ